MKHVISMSDFRREDIATVIEIASAFQSQTFASQAYPGKLVVVMTLEGSLRTGSSYHEAASRLGCRVRPIRSGSDISFGAKGESLSATLRMEAGYGASVIAMRSPIEGGARWGSEMLQRYGHRTAIHNLGDGTNQHPTQAMLDMLTLSVRNLNTSDLRIGIVGDLKNSRTVHSLLQALRLHGTVNVKLLSAPEVALQPWYLDGLACVEVDAVEELDDCQIVYVTRVQRERFDSSLEYERVRGRYSITAATLRQLGRDVFIMHPQPVVDGEVHPEIWLHPQVIMDQQAALGVQARMALLRGSFESLDTVLSLDSASPELEEEETGTTTEALQRKHQQHRYFVPIENGTVIDHLPSGTGQRIRRMLDGSGDGVQQVGVVVLSESLRTQRLAGGRKDTLVLEGRWLSPHEMACVSLLAPEATFNSFREGVHRKVKVKKVTDIQGLGRCPNARCVTQLDPEAKLHPRFHVRLVTALGEMLQCHYCEQHFDRREVLVD